MLNNKNRDEVIKRLSRIEGQVRGIIKMIQEERYCIDVLAQTRATVAAIRKVEEQIMHNHMKTCVLDAFVKGKQEDQREKISEIMNLLALLQR